MANVLESIPGLGGYLAMQDYRQRQALGDMQGAIGLLGAVRQQQEAEREAQVAPLRMQALQAQVQQAQELAQERQQAQALQQALPGIFQQSTGPDGQIDFNRASAALMQTPGGLKYGMDLRRAEEDRAARVQQSTALLEQRREQATQLHEFRLSQAQTAAERAAETARHNRFMEGIQGQLVALRSQGGGGDSRREPFKFSMNGQNVQGWRDRLGNVYTQDGRAVTGYQPEISASDQTAEQKRTVEAETLSSVNDMLTRVERIAAENPGTVAGVGGAARNATTWLWNQFGGSATGNAKIAPNDQAVQLRDSMLTSLGSLGRLSNQDRQRIEGIWGLSMLGSPAKVNEAIALTRQVINSKYAGSKTPVGRPTPGAAPPVGTIQDGYRFKGGNPADQANWEKQ